MQVCVECMKHPASEVIRRIVETQLLSEICPRRINMLRGNWEILYKNRENDGDVGLNTGHKRICLTCEISGLTILTIKRLVECECYNLFI